MGKQDSGKVIPLFPASDARNGAPAFDAMHDLVLSRRRGFDTVEPVAAPRRPAPSQPATRQAGLTPSRLSALFIESLDDMIRGTPGSMSAEAWPGRGDPALEKVAADVIDMLFGFVLEEPVVPRGVKEALLRAQLPVLQLAMRDTSFFADWQHPARRLLNEVAPMVRAFIERGGEAARFEQRFVSELDRALDELAPNTATFASLYGTLRRFAYDEAVAETSDESEAWERAQAIVRDFLERPMPQLAREFLIGYWVDVLQRTALSHPSDSLQWQDAVEVIEDLAWSLTPKQEETDRLQLIALIPALLHRLNRGLDLIDLPREDRRPFFDALIEIHTDVLRVEMTPPTASSEILAPVLEEEPPIEQVMRLARGDWVEFVAADGSVNRERLTWISPQRGILVFSNHGGQRAIQISPEDLADLVAEGRATLIFDQPDTETGKNSA